MVNFVAIFLEKLEQGSDQKPVPSHWATNTELVVPLLTFACRYFGESCDTAVVDVQTREYTHHHSPDLKYLPTPPQQVLVVTRTVPLAVAIAICQFLSTARQWIAKYLCKAHLVLSLTWRRWCSPGLFLGPFIVPTFNSNLCRSN